MQLHLMQTLHTICTVLVSVIGLLYAYRTVYFILGFFRTRKFPLAKRFHRYAILICARNEQEVIGNLLDSIALQDYPQDKLTVFVCADNCTDETARICRDRGAVVYERTDPERKTKGYALDYLFSRLDRDYGIDFFEGYFVFDADNLLARDYISRMNDAFDSGETIVTSYRNTKNFDANWISAGYAFHWLRTVRFDSRARSYLGLSTRVQGCGFLFASELVREGWRYVTLTEDRAFTIDAVAEGGSVCFQHEAVFYDEQPTDLKVALRQRIRWAKGHLEAFRDYGGKLLGSLRPGKGARRILNCYDMLMMAIPYSLVMVPLKLLNFITAAGCLLAVSNLEEQWMTIAFEAVSLLIFEHFAAIPLAVLLLISERKRLPKVPWYKAAWYALLFPIFDIIGVAAVWIALFKRVAWDPIPHHAALRIEEMERRGR